MIPPLAVAARVLLSPDDEVLAHVFSGDAGTVTFWHGPSPRVEVAASSAEWYALHLRDGRRLAGVQSLGLGIIVHDPSSVRSPP